MLLLVIILDPNNILKNYKDSDLSTYLNLQKAETSYDTDNGEKILKVINWKKLQINSFLIINIIDSVLTNPLNFIIMQPVQI